MLTPQDGGSHSRLIEQVAEAPVPDNVQEPALVPGNVTVPVGVIVVPTSVSVTVAVHVKGCLNTTVVAEHVLFVLVARRLTVTPIAFVLMPWVALPL